MRAYEDSVFINVPFDRKYARLGDAIVFAVYDCGFVCRSALQVDDGGQARVDKILDLIEQSKFGIHDISRAGIDRNTRFARFNMPLELGFFLGAKRYGNQRDREKRCLILDRTPYRYRSFCSDISGQDIRVHNDQPRDAIRAVRDWLSSHRTEVAIPGGKAIFDRYQRFRAQLPQQAREINLDYRELTFNDYTRLVAGYLAENPWLIGATPAPLSTPPTARPTSR
ncbi:MAG: hypothetical protein QOE68_3730 [Thermoanaerobaculia bacterium]|jgi:hypothetical protein|nr:hypothetical protein [Thermoanaerobaculia bacterium]